MTSALICFEEECGFLSSVSHNGTAIISMRSTARFFGHMTPSMFASNDSAHLGMVRNLVGESS